MARNFKSSSLAAVLLAVSLPLSGCGTLNSFSGMVGRAATVLFTSASLADLQIVGVKSGPLIPVGAGDLSASIAAGTAANQGLSDALDKIPLGALLPITKVGDTTPMWVFCPAGDLQQRCQEIPSNARVTFTGEPLGHSVVFLATHLTWSAQ